MGCTEAGHPGPPPALETEGGHSVRRLLLTFFLDLLLQLKELQLPVPVFTMGARARLW